MAAMDCDQYIDDLLDEPPKGRAPATSPPRQRGDEEPAQRHRDRLTALVAGGQAAQYLGRAYTTEQIDALGDLEIEKLYARYEARLGAAMTKTLGQAALQLYAGVASMFLPIPVENRAALVADLEVDPFVGHALSNTACELFYRYGMLLAPLTAALTTAKHCRFGQTPHPPMPEAEDVGAESGTRGAIFAEGRGAAGAAGAATSGKGDGPRRTDDE